MIKVETKGLELKRRYVNDLQNVFARSEIPRVIRNETIRILIRLAKREKKATKSKLAKEGRRVGINKTGYTGDESLSVNSGRRGGRRGFAWVRIKTKSGNVFIPAGKWDGNKSIANIGKVEDVLLMNLLQQAKKDMNLQKKIYEETQGSVAKSWLVLAQNIWNSGDIDPDRGNKINKAKKKNRKPYLTTATEFKTKNSYKLLGTITSPVLKKNGGQARVDFEYQKRALFLRRAIKNGWLKQADFQRRNLGGIYVTRTFF